MAQVQRGKQLQEEQLKFAPVVFQEFIACRYDIRVTVIGNELFAMRIDSQADSFLVDWRLHQDAPMEPIELSPSISQKCIELTRTLGLVYGAIDMRESPDGDCYFFEINPAGQFLFAEPDTDLPITQALYRALALGTATL